MRPSPRLRKRVLTTGLVVLLGGCAHRAAAPTPPPARVIYVDREVVKPAPPSTDALLFFAYLDEMASDDSVALATLQREHPDSPWTARAQHIHERLSQAQQRAARAQRDAQLQQKQLEACVAQREDAAEQAALLRAEHENLKALVIESEQREHLR